MKWEDIIKKYKEEWVLLEVIKVDKNLRIKEGNVGSIRISQQANEVFHDHVAGKFPV